MVNSTYAIPIPVRLPLCLTTCNLSVPNASKVTSNAVVRMVSLGRQKQCLTFLSQSPQQTKIPFYQSLSWRTKEFIVLTEQGEMCVSGRIVGHKVATVKGLHASRMMASPWLSAQPIHSSPSTMRLPQATCWKEWQALKSSPLLLGGNVNIHKLNRGEVSHSRFHEDGSCLETHIPSHSA